MHSDEVFTFKDITISLQSHPLVWSPTGFARNMAVHVAEHLRPGDRVLELGLGSGVLAILAAKLGAAQVTGLDINPQAVTAATENWRANGLDEGKADFRHSDLFSALGPADFGRFDLLISNPPVLPAIGDGPDKDPGEDPGEYSGAPFRREIRSRNDFEIAGRDGRRLLDTVLREGGKHLKPDGRLLTIATSLQGWQETEEILSTHWQNWEIRQTLALELTDECTPPYMDYWRRREREDGRRRFYQQDGRLLHDVWYLGARQPALRSHHA